MRLTPNNIHIINDYYQEQLEEIDYENKLKYLRNNTFLLGIKYNNRSKLVKINDDNIKLTGNPLHKRVRNTTLNHSSSKCKEIVEDLYEQTYIPKIVKHIDNVSLYMSHLSIMSLMLIILTYPINYFIELPFRPYLFKFGGYVFIPIISWFFIRYLLGYNYPTNFHKFFKSFC